MTSPLPESRRPRILWAIGIAVVVLMLFVTFLRRTSDAPKPKAATASARANEAAELQRQLRATLDGLRPERVYVSSDPQDLTGDLNLWWAEFSKTADVPDADGFAAAVQEWLGDEAAASVAAGRFDLRDALHVRDGLFYRSIAESLNSAGATERQRVEAAFHRVVRHIALRPGSASTVPLGSFEVLLSGRGSADDRIWALAEILRQRGIDCVVLEPKSPPADAPLPPKLVGAIVKGEGMLLFDPQLGLPISPLDDTTGALPTRAATFQEARQNDALFRQFDVPGGPAYPWTAELLGDVNVRFILDSAAASPRMLTLQTALPADHAAKLFDGPAASAESPSLRDRVIAAGADRGWTVDAVSAWQYPEQQLAAFSAAGAEQSADVRNLLATQYGPRVLMPQTVEGVEVLQEADSKEPLRVARILHLRGDIKPALGHYTSIRSQPLEYLLAGQPRTIDNSAVRNDAVYWTAVCQEELERYGVAISTLNLWLRNYPNGLWASPSKAALARCEAQQGNLQQAIELLAPADGTPPTGIADAYLLRRWQSLSTAPATTPNDAE